MAYINQCYYLMCSILIFVLGYCAFNSLAHPLDGNDTTWSTKHEQWMATYGRTYKDLAEKEKRFKIFKENVEHIEYFNRASPSNNILYTLGANEFADLTDEEFIATYTGSKSLSPLQSIFVGETTTNFKYANITNVSSSMNWREKGAVTPIKDQKKCGCCWAFSVVATIEGLNQINTGILTSLSEQELVDCDHTNKGCESGSMKKAYKFISKNQGILSDQVYPYKAIQGQCEKLEGKRVTIKGYEKVPAGDEDALLKAVSKQPVAARIDSSGIKHYKTGIYNGQCVKTPHHAVTIIGYGTENGNDYWLVKNSWGENWGENGYIRMLRGHNTCDLAGKAYYPI